MSNSGRKSARARYAEIQKEKIVEEKQEVKAEESKKPKRNVDAVYAEYGFGPVENIENLEKTALDIDVELKQELDDLGFACRWINYKYYKEHGFHKNGWKPFRRQSRPSGDAMYVVNPDGYMIRNDLILAVKPKSYVEVHRRKLRDKTRFQAQTQKNKKAEMEQFARDSGLGAKVIDDVE